MLDPVNAGTVYLGTAGLGIWKSTDCGSTWTHVNTGQHGADLDAGRNWSLAIDPTQSNVLYAVSGYGPGGVYKSTNAGVDWAQVLPPDIMAATGGFMEKITIEPLNNQHLLASFHTDCSGTPLPGAMMASDGWGCLAETTDAGGTWHLTTSVPWSGSDGPGQTMIDATTWFYATNGYDGIWRTTTGGVSVDGSPAWTQVYDGSTNGSVYVASDGTYYTGGNAVLWSGDQGVTWNAIAGSPPVFSINGSAPMVDDGTHLYIGAYPGATWWSADLTTPPSSFSMMSSTPGSIGNANIVVVPGWLEYDSAHNLLYSSNVTGGFWRYVTQ